MMIFNELKIILIGLIAYLGIDFIWLGFLMRNFYIRELGNKLKMVNGNLVLHWPSAIAAWFLLVLGIYVFVLPRVMLASIIQAFLYGALYGIIVYGAYNLTNYATLAGWTLNVVIADIMWGAVINGIVTSILWYFKK